MQQSGFWRTYSPPRDVIAGGDLPDRSFIAKFQARSLDRQREKLSISGFTGEFSEIGHLVSFQLRARNYTRAAASYGGQLASTGGDYNYQGNARIAAHLRFSERTIQRARAQLEKDGWIRSHILERGQCVPGQRPVRHAQVVRELRKLLGLARARARCRDKKPESGHIERGRGAPAARVHVRKTAAPANTNRATPLTAEDFAEIARRTAHSEFSGYAAGVSYAKAKAPAPPAAAAPARVPPDDRVGGDRPLGASDELGRATPATGRGPPNN